MLDVHLYEALGFRYVSSMTPLRTGREPSVGSFKPEHELEKIQGNAAGGAPEHLGLQAVFVKKARGIIDLLTAIIGIGIFHLEPILDVVVGIEQFSQGNRDDLFHLPVQSEMLLSGHPPHHGIDDPPEHDQSLDRQRSQKTDTEWIQAHLFETLHAGW